MIQHMKPLVKHYRSLAITTIISTKTVMQISQKYIEHVDFINLEATLCLIFSIIQKIQNTFLGDIRVNKFYKSADEYEMQCSTKILITLIVNASMEIQK